MANMKTIKRRIKSVSSTMQITKAMELVASSKLRRAKQKTASARPYFEEQHRMLTEISRSHNIDTVFTRNRESGSSGQGSTPPGNRRLYIVIAGDRGLAGGYNSSIFKLVSAAHESHSEKAEKPKIIAVGKKAVEYFEKRGYDIINSKVGLDLLKPGHCSDIANMAVKLFLDGSVDEVQLFYTKFVSSMTQEASIMPLLPINAAQFDQNQDDDGKAESNAKQLGEITYDPAPEAVFNRIVPCFLMSLIQCAVTESYASEQCARRVAMESASDNAEEMIENLSLLYNRARQEKITNEINEIVGGANAL
ncbi:MAG: ATP synthase F1 subunit gamma [Oscillospiraceae bacterium]|nr:ATP synthase F1 subunit gamma [Oscillospiraceae bacterium]